MKQKWFLFDILFEKMRREQKQEIRFFSFLHYFISRQNENSWMKDFDKRKCQIEV
jgi:hypothetical protein